MITEQHYASLKKLRNRGTEVLSKDRVSFVWRNQHIEIDVTRGDTRGFPSWKRGLRDRRGRNRRPIAGFHYRPQKHHPQPPL